MSQTEIRRLFEESTEQEFAKARKFKRNVLGICGTESVKTLEEMARELYLANVSTSIDDGIDLAKELHNVVVRYSPSSEMIFDHVYIEESNDLMYRVRVVGSLATQIE